MHATATAKAEQDKIDLAPWGYAPGDRLVTCNDCARQHPLDSLHFLHKHATRCAKHALEARMSDIRAQEGVTTLDPDQATQEAVYAMIQAYNDTWVRLAFIGSILFASAIVGWLLFAQP